MGKFARAVYNGWGRGVPVARLLVARASLPRMCLSGSLLVLLLLSTTAVFSASTGELSSSRPRGFIHTIGQNFAIESQPFFFAGANAYWFQFLDVRTISPYPCLTPLEITRFGRTSVMWRTRWIKL